MKEYKIKTESRGIEILAKAKELGYNRLYAEMKNRPYIYLYNDGSVFHGSIPVNFDKHQNPEISVDEFLKLGEKPDAYVVESYADPYVDLIICTKSGIVAESVYDLHKYNLMSKEEYKAKYPDKLQLKGHDVEFLSDNFVKIGTVTFHSYMLRLLFRNIKDHGNDPCEFNNVTIEDLFHFISENKEKFGL